MLTLEKITKTFNPGTPDACTLFDGFDLTVENGEFVSVIGSNGSGKTTLLNFICGTLAPDSGRILFDNRDITKLCEYRRAKRIGRVFQDPKAGTCANLTILENMALADNKHGMFGLGSGINKKRIDVYRALLEECGLGLENRMNAPVGSLSGGQRQALTLLMATIAKPKLLLLDEHTAALDPGAAEKILAMTTRIAAEQKLTCLMVTHNMRAALALGNRTLMMNNGQIVLDVSGAERAHMEVNDLLERFKSGTGAALDNDRILLS